MCIRDRYRDDARSGVRKLIARYQKEQEKLAAERERLEQMRIFEREYERFAYICGIDEVGRGPLAGPVVAGAVILPKDCEILWINDSKKLSAKKREELYTEIVEKADEMCIRDRAYRYLCGKTRRIGARDGDYKLQQPV